MRSRVALLLLGLISLGLSVHVAMLAPPLWDADERAHAGYALAVWHGQLPTIDTPVPDEPANFPEIAASLAVQPDQAHRDIWTANHPPLYYVLSAPMLGAADAANQPGDGLLAMRLLNALGMAASVVLVGLLAAELVPRRPAVAVLAATFAASCVTVSHLGGLILNDGLAVAASSAALLLAIRMVRHGPAWRPVVTTALLGAAAAGLRAPGVVAVATCALAVALAGRRHRAPFWRTAGMTALVCGVPVAAAGWFYLRNVELYGDPGGTSALLAKFGRQRRGSVLEWAVRPNLYVNQFKELWLRLNLGWPWLAVGPIVVFGLAGVGLVLTLLRHRFRVDPLPWLLLGGYSLVVEASVVSFYAAGGNGHVRYLIPSLPLIGTLVAVGLLGLFGGAVDWWGTALFGALLLGYAGVVQARSSRQILDTIRPGLRVSTVGGSTPWIVLAVVAGLAVAFLVTVVSRGPETRSAGVLPQPAQEPQQ